MDSNNNYYDNLYSKLDNLEKKTMDLEKDINDLLKRIESNINELQIMFDNTIKLIIELERKTNSKKEVK